MAATASDNRPTSLAAGGFPPQLFQWIFWEKVGIWGLFLLVLYILRSFFLTIFLTFLVSYMMRSLVELIMPVISPGQRRIWLEKILTIVLFCLLLLGLWGLGRYFGPKLVEQGQKLVTKVTSLNYESEFRKLLSRTMGVYLFSRDYGDRSDPRYQKGFEEFVKAGPRRLKAFEDFPELVNRIEAPLRHVLEDAVGKRVDAELAAKPDDARRRFEEWFLAERAPALLDEKKQAWIDRWRENVIRTRGQPALEEIEKAPTAAAVRNAEIYRDILTVTSKDPSEANRYRQQWRATLVASGLAKAEADPEYRARLEARFTEERNSVPDLMPADFARYEALKKAHARGPVVFTRELGLDEKLSEEERNEQTRQDFEAGKRLELAKTWWETDPTAHNIKEAASKTVAEVLSSVGHSLQHLVKHLIAIPVEISLSLLLSFFITWDMPLIRRGLNHLRRSRISNLYEEMAPGLITFGKLIGRSFLSQACIAAANTVLTYLAIKLIGVENEIFLSAIVFLASFIPVLGTVLSTVPIAVIALVQPNGSIWMVMWVVIAILVVHFIETSVLNPKIIGEIMHLHPVLVLTVLAIGEHFFGMWGLLLAVPVTVYVIQFMIFDTGIPGIIDPIRSLPPLEDGPEPAGH